MDIFPGSGGLCGAGGTGGIGVSSTISISSAQMPTMKVIPVMTKQIPTRMVNRIVKDCRQCLKKYGGKLVLDRQQSNLSDTESLPAYFCEEPLEVRVSVKGRTPVEWLPDLLHEMAHFDQWRTGAAVWTNLYVGDADASALAELWVDHQIELTPLQANKVFGKIAALELDAEQRCVQEMVTWGLDAFINIEDYIRAARLYVDSYYIVAQQRMWFQLGYEPYKNAVLVAKTEPVWGGKLPVMNDYAQYYDGLIPEAPQTIRVTTGWRYWWGEVKSTWRALR